EAGAVGIIEGAEAHDRPRGLGGGAGTLALEDRIIVRVAALAPAAVGPLDALEPVAGADDPWLAHAVVERAQPAEHLPRSVDVVDPPAAEERAVALLGVADEIEGAPHLRVVEPGALMAHHLEDARGDVHAFRVEHGVVIGEGNLLEHALG